MDLTNDTQHLSRIKQKQIPKQFAGLSTQGKIDKFRELMREIETMNDIELMIFLQANFVGIFYNFDEVTN